MVRTLVGEGSRAGLPCVLVRLAGCPLRCAYCDTVYAREGGTAVALEELLLQLQALAPPRVLVTGGEPLSQAGGPALLAALVAAGYETLLETSGAFDLASVPAGVRRIVDVKLPGSGEQHRARLDDLDLLGPGDEIKFVIADRVDFDLAQRIVVERRLQGRCELLFSPVHGQLEPAQLAGWLVQAGLDVRLSVQLHRLAFSDADLDRGAESAPARHPESGK